MESYRSLQLNVHLPPKCLLKGTRKSSISIPKCTQIFSKNMLIASCPLLVFLHGTRMHILINLSISTNRWSCPFLILGKSPLKSTDMFSHGLVSTSKGWHKPWFLSLGFLAQQIMHPLINSATSSYILGQYTYHYELAIIFTTLKFPITMDVWIHLISCNLSSSGTQSLPSLYINLSWNYNQPYCHLLLHYLGLVLARPTL